MYYHFIIFRNINCRDVQRKNVINNVDKSSLRAPWQNGPHKNQHTERHKTRRTPWCNRHLKKCVIFGNTNVDSACSENSSFRSYMYFEWNIPVCHAEVNGKLILAPFVSFGVNSYQKYYASLRFWCSVISLYLFSCVLLWRSCVIWVYFNKRFIV